MRRATLSGLAVSLLAGSAIVGGCTTLFGIENGVLGADAAAPPPSDGGLDGNTATDAPGDHAQPPNDSNASDGTCAANTQIDPANCGACGHDCLKGTCMSGVCTAFVVVQPPNTQEFTWVTTDGTNVVFGDDGNGVIAQIPVGGGTLLLLEKVSPYGIAVGGGKVGYFNNGPKTFDILTEGVPDSGFAQNTGFLSGNCPSVAITPDGMTQFFILEDQPNDAVIYFCDAVTSQSISTITGTPQPNQIVANAANAYWGDPPNGNVWTYSLSPPMTKTIATGQSQPDWVAIDTGYVYWANEGVPNIVRQAMGATTIQTVTTLPSPIAGLASDGNYIYYAQGHNVYYAPAGGGGSPKLLFSNTGANNVRITVAGGFIVWLDVNLWTVYGARTPL